MGGRGTLGTCGHLSLIRAQGVRCLAERSRQLAVSRSASYTSSRKCLCTFMSNRLLSPVSGKADMGWKECRESWGGISPLSPHPTAALTSSAPQLLQSAAVDSFKSSLQETAVSKYAFEGRMCKYFTTVL